MASKKKIDWRNGGKVDIKVGDTSRTEEDFNTLNELKMYMTEIVEQDVCDDCGSMLAGKYYVSYQQRNLFDAEESKGLLGNSKTKYVKRETVFTTSNWGAEDVKCKSCKKKIFGQKTLNKNAKLEERKEQRAENREVRKEQRAENREVRKDKHQAQLNKRERDMLSKRSLTCKACGWRGNELTWRESNGCPRCRNQEIKIGALGFRK